MRKLLKIMTLSILILFTNCSEKDDLDYKDLKTIEIGDYKFEFPSNFKLIELQGIDSYVGKVVGYGITLTFDFGYYSGGPNGYIPENTYDIIEDMIDGHSRQIFVAKNPKSDTTSINFYDLNGYSDSINSYLALSMGTNNLTIEEQELVVKILKSGLPIE